MLQKIFLTFIVIIFISNSAYAAKIDAYRNAIKNKTFTIKYQITNPPIYQSNNEGKLANKGFFQRSVGQALTYHNGLVVENGEDRYSETYISSQFSSTYRDLYGKISTTQNKTFNVGKCQLKKNGEVFNFNYEFKDGVKRYYSQGTSGKNSSVKADENNFLTPYQVFLSKYNLGSPVLTKAFLPIIPPERVIDTPQTPRYKFIGSGNLQGGLSFEDFASDRDNIFSAIRYYFEGDKLVKIAQASYLKNGSEVAAYEKSVINIVEFSSTPDQRYLSLPAELKDKTKRN